MFEEKLKKIVDRFDFLEKEMQRNLDRNTFEEYSRNMSNYMWVRDIWAKYSKPCLDEGHLNGSGILPPAQPIRFTTIFDFCFSKVFT